MTAQTFTGPACDVCNGEAALFSLMRLDTYETVKCGPSCGPDVLEAIAASMREPDGQGAAAAPASVAAPADATAAAAAAPGGGGQAAAGPAVPPTGQGQPTEVTIPAPDAAALAATAAQLEQLQRLGITEVDTEPCPVCVTMTNAAMGHDRFVCPWCGHEFNPRTGAGYPEIAAAAADAAGRPGEAADTVTEVDGSGRVSTVYLPGDPRQGQGQ